MVLVQDPSSTWIKKSENSDHDSFWQQMICVWGPVWGSDILMSLGWTWGTRGVCTPRSLLQWKWRGWAGGAAQLRCPLPHIWAGTCEGTHFFEADSNWKHVWGCATFPARGWRSKENRGERKVKGEWGRVSLLTSIPLLLGFRCSFLNFWEGCIKKNTTTKPNKKQRKKKKNKNEK